LLSILSVKTWGADSAKREKRVTNSNSQSNLHIGPSQCETRELQPYPERVIGRFFSLYQAVYCNVALISPKFERLQAAIVLDFLKWSPFSLTLLLASKESDN